MRQEYLHGFRRAAPLAACVAVVAGLGLSAPALAKPAAAEVKDPKQAWKSPDPVLQRDLGFGILAGDPAALGVRYWAGQSFALQAWVGGTFQHNGVQATVDAQYGVRNLLENRDVVLDLSLGGGVFFGTSDTPRCRDPWRWCSVYAGQANVFFGVHFVSTFSVHLKRLPLEFFVEVAPGMRIFPAGWALDGGVGARYWL